MRRARLRASLDSAGAPSRLLLPGWEMGALAKSGRFHGVAPLRIQRLCSSSEGRSGWIPDRLPPSHLRPGSRAGDGGCRTMGRATRRSGDLAFAGGVSHGDGVRWNAGADGCADSGHRVRHRVFRPFCLGAAVMFEYRPRARSCGCAGRLLRHLSRTRARNRASARSERSSI